MAIATARRSANGNEHRIRIGHSRFQIGGKGQAARLDVVGDHLVQTGLIDRHHVFVQQLNLAGVLIDASDIDAEFRKASS